MFWKCFEFEQYSYFERNSCLKKIKYKKTEQKHKTTKYKDIKQERKMEKKK